MNKNTRKNSRAKSGAVKHKKTAGRNATHKTGRAATRSGGERAANDGLYTVDGVIDCKGDRFGFISRGGNLDDVFIAGQNLCGARHGDSVRAIIISDRPGRVGRRVEGRVIEVTERNPQNVVATVFYVNNTYVARPDDRRFGEDLPITVMAGASEYDKVIIRVVPDERGDTAEVLSVLGRFDEIGMDVKSVIAAHNLRTEFPADAISQADAYPDEIDDEEARAPYRRDFRGRVIFTIDGSDSKDFDDAVSLERTENGYLLGVYIADVAQYVTDGSPLDREAFLRGTSVYLADRVIPMLPEKLSNGLCSLNEGEDRLVLAVLIELDERGNVIKSELTEGVIRSCARLTYTGVQAMLDGDEEQKKRYPDVFPVLMLMRELCQKRIKIRARRGSVDFKLTETEIKFDGAGHVTDIAQKPALFSMKIIEEFMILANCAVAERFCKAKTPFVFRTHDKPVADKLEALNDFLDATGLNLRCPEEPEPRQVAELLSEVERRAPSVFGAVSHVALRAMAKAAYEPRNAGHFGLAEKFYCHFTSPIRRYPDLCIHRIIKAYLRGGASATRRFKTLSEAAAEQSSKTERVAQECERKVDDLKKAEYMSHHIGENYVGVISSVTDFGFFVELPNSAEGLVRLSSLPPSAFFDSRRFLISCGMQKYRLGDRVGIVVEKVEGDRVDFLLSYADTDDR